MLPFNMVIVESYVKFFQFWVLFYCSFLILNIKAVLSEANNSKEWEYFANNTKRNDRLLPVWQCKFFHSPKPDVVLFAHTLEKGHIENVVFRLEIELNFIEQNTMNLKLWERKDEVVKRVKLSSRSTLSHKVKLYIVKW